MEHLESRAKDLGKLVQQILRQFQLLGDDIACGPSSLGHHDLRIIEYLGESGQQKMRSVAGHLGLAVNTMTTIIDHLEQKGLVQRTRSSTDRRVIYVALTEDGRRIFEEVAQAKLSFHRSLLSVLAEEEQEQLLFLFRKIASEAGKQVDQSLKAESSSV